MLIIAVLAEGDVLGPGIVLPSDPFSAFPAVHSFHFQAAGTQTLTIKGVEFCLRYLTSTSGAGVWLVGHDDRLLYNKVKAPGNYPEAFTVIIYTSFCGGYGTRCPMLRIIRKKCRHHVYIKIEIETFPLIKSIINGASLVCCNHTTGILKRMYQ